MTTEKEKKSLNKLLLAFFNPKGGVGKSTLSTQTSVAATMNDYKVAFYDLDKQKTATFYFSTIDEKYRPPFIGHSLEEQPPADTNLIVVDCPPNLDFVPPKEFLIVAPTSSTMLDLHAFREVLKLEAKGYKVIKVINNFNQIRKDDKALLDEFKNAAIITSNSGIRSAMNNGKSIWNSNHPGGRKAKRQFNYLLKCIAQGFAPPIDIATINKISEGKGE